MWASTGLLTDLYQLTMAYGYWKAGIHNRRAVFHLFYRKPPFGGPHVITSGLKLIIDYLEQLCFTDEDIQYLGQLKGADGQVLFEKGFLTHLAQFKFSCSVDAAEEGTIIFPHEPIFRVDGPLLQAQIIETALLNIVNFSSLIATKAGRIHQVTMGEDVLEFGLRRAQGIDGGLSASRAAYIGGCSATSNVLAGKLFDIPVKGTHAHSWVMCFENELEAFQQYAATMPNNCIFLVDTYDTLEGVENAIAVGRALRRKGHDLLGIRLDSGDLAALSKQARILLDAAGFAKTKIVASNDLDEYRIQALKENGAQISVWGVGTKLATAFDQPALGGVYKLGAIEKESGSLDYKVKLSEQAVKISNPGVLQIKRFRDKNGLPIGDMIFDIHHKENLSQIRHFKTAKVFNFEKSKGELLLKRIFERGKLVYQVPTIHKTRAYCLQQQNLFSQLECDDYPAGLEENLYQTKMQIINAIKQQKREPIQR